jgi:hypothetical protein
VCSPALVSQSLRAVQLRSQVANLLLGLLHQHLQHHGILLVLVLLVLQGAVLRATSVHYSSCKTY